MDEELKQLVGDIRRAFSDARILLFGSRAKRTSRKDSDYDLIVVSKKFEKIPFVDRACAVWVSTRANIAADLLCYSPGEVNDVAKNSIVLRDALKHAVVL